MINPRELDEFDLWPIRSDTGTFRTTTLSKCARDSPKTVNCYSGLQPVTTAADLLIREAVELSAVV